MSAGPAAPTASVFYRLGISAYYRGEIEVAQTFVALACVDPDAPAIWHRNHGVMLDRAGLSAAAEAAARRAVRRDPDCANAWDTLGPSFNAAHLKKAALVMKRPL